MNKSNRSNVTSNGDMIDKFIAQTLEQALPDIAEKRVYNREIKHTKSLLLKKQHTKEKLAQIYARKNGLQYKPGMGNFLK